jgi:hypothetical protein
MYSEQVRRISMDADDSIGIFTGISGMPGSAIPNTGKQFCFVKVVGNKLAGLATAATDPILGILTNKPQHPGTGAAVAISGVTPLEVGSGGDLTAGDFVDCDADGCGVTGSHDTAMAICVLGAAAGEYATVRLLR